MTKYLGDSCYPAVIATELLLVTVDLRINIRDQGAI